MPACELKLSDKKAFIGGVGEELAKRYEKKKYYKTDDIGRAATARGYPIDIHCWAYCIFSLPEDFKALHDAAGEVCDYVKMKTEVLTDLVGGGFQWHDIALSWLEWPDIDLSRIFDWLDCGVHDRQTGRTKWVGVGELGR